jgi:hypothetical protein
MLVIRDLPIGPEFAPTKVFLCCFPILTVLADKRAQFFQHNLEIEKLSEFKDGFGVTKYRNKTKSGGFGQDPEKTFSDIDFPLFRLGEAYLIFAEAVKRGGTGGTLDRSHELF